MILPRYYDIDGNDLRLFDGVIPEDDSVLEEAVMGERQLTMHYKTRTRVDIPVGMFTYYPTDKTPQELISEGVAGKYVYRLCEEAQVTEHNTGFYEYTFTMLSPVGQLQNRAMADTHEEEAVVMGRPVKVMVYDFPVSEFSLTGTPADHLQKVVNALNAKNLRAGYGGEKVGGGRLELWRVGDAIHADDKTITYSNTSVFEALNMIADTFGTEWYIDGLTINIGKQRHDLINPLRLEYGFDKGLLSGVTRGTGGEPIHALYVNGTDRNIDMASYGAKRLRMAVPPTTPYGYATILFDGLYTNLDEEYNDEPVAEYQADFYGAVLFDNASTGKEEHFSDDSVYPRKVFVINEVTYVYRGVSYLWSELIDQYPELEDNTNEQWQYVQVDIAVADNDVDFNQHKVDGEVMTIVFQSGELAGKEFPFRYYHEVVGTKSPYRFELEKQSNDGYDMPVYPYVPQEGDRFSVFNISLPTSYYEDAERELLRKACAYLYDNNKQKYAVDAKVDGIWATRHWNEVGEKFRINQQAVVSIGGADVPVRISRLITPVTRPQAPEVELTNDYVTKRRSTRQAQERGKDSEGKKGGSQRRTATDAIVATSAGTYRIEDEVMAVNATTGTASVIFRLPTPQRIGRYIDFSHTNGGQRMSVISTGARIKYYDDTEPRTHYDAYDTQSFRLLFDGQVWRMVSRNIY